MRRATAVLLGVALSAAATAGSCTATPSSDSPPPALSLADDWVRTTDYSFSIPAGWKAVDPQGEPRPDSMIAPTEPGLPYYIAVDRALPIGTSTLDEVVAQLRAGFSGTGSLEGAPQRQVGGLAAAGVVVDDPPRSRHAYAICTYARRAFPIRVTYDPDHEREALAVFDAVLDSWSWG